MSIKSKLKINTREGKAKLDPVDHSLVVIILMLLCFGLVMVFSASSANAHYVHGNATFFFKKQLVWAVAGLAAMWVVSTFPYKKIKQFSNLLFVVTILLLVIVKLAGKEINGARRWLGFGSLTFQPSEVAKLTLILFLAKSITVYPNRINQLKNGYLRYLLIIAFVAGLVLLQPHLSGALVIAVGGMAVLFAAGYKKKYFIGTALCGIPLVIYLAIAEPYRFKRITTFLDPFSDMLGESWQIVQSLYAIGSGGLFGLGLGQSRQKFLYIPEPQNDFIFAIICEELGFVGAVFLMFLFALLIWKGIMIAKNAPDEYSALVATGITSLVAVQVLMNIAVVTSTIPVTGVPLPFFSYGGSSLMILLMEMGILLNISRNIEK